MNDRERAAAEWGERMGRLMSRLNDGFRRSNWYIKDIDTLVRLAEIMDN